MPAGPTDYFGYCELQSAFVEIIFACSYDTGIVVPLPLYGVKLVADTARLYTVSFLLAW